MCTSAPELAVAVPVNVKVISPLLPRPAPPWGDAQSWNGDETPTAVPFPSPGQFPGPSGLDVVQPVPWLAVIPTLPPMLEYPYSPMSVRKPVLGNWLPVGLNWTLNELFVKVKSKQKTRLPVVQVVAALADAMGAAHIIAAANVTPMNRLTMS